jgi:acyl-coenzyme A thioesterase PaaI-like protein
VNLAMSFFRPTRGDRIAAEARLVRSGLNLVFAAAEILDGDGRVTARCDGTCAIALGKSDSQEIYERMRGGGVAP